MDSILAARQISVYSMFIAAELGRLRWPLQALLAIWRSYDAGTQVFNVFYTVTLTEEPGKGIENKDVQIMLCAFSL